MPRLHIQYGRGEQAKYVGHLDLMRAWERAIRRAGIPVAYSQGFSPHPRFATAAPLPVGITSQAELLDVWLGTSMDPGEAARRLEKQMPPGMSICGISSVPDDAPSPGSRLIAAEYVATVLGEDVSGCVTRLLGRPSVPWHEVRGGKTRDLDLRVLIEDLEVMREAQEGSVLAMRLRAGAGGTARPQAVISVLGLRPSSIHRVRLILAD